MTTPHNPLLFFGTLTSERGPEGEFATEITLRDLLAGMAAASLAAAAAGDDLQFNCDEITRAAGELADAQLAAREQK